MQPNSSNFHGALQRGFKSQGAPPALAHSLHTAMPESGDSETGQLPEKLHALYYSNFLVE